MTASPEDIAKWRAEPANDRQYAIAAKYGVRLEPGTTSGEFFDLLGDAMKRADPSLGATAPA